MLDLKSQISNHRTFSLSHFLTFALVLCLAPMLGGGCNSPPGSTGEGGVKSIFSQSSPGGKERWTIRALRSSAPGHQVFVARLADELKRVPGLQPSKVRMVSNANGSTIYYGEYVKVASPTDANKLVFPAEYQRDMETLRRLTMNQSAPFLYAEPELVEKPDGSDRGPYDIARAPGTYTLQIAVFYNTPGFDQRREAADQYVKLLREAGYSAYYRHENLRSYVFVGDFNDTDVVAEPGGAIHYGPRVEAFINARPDEFKYLTENGHLRKYSAAGGQMVPPQSYLVPVPREGQAASPVQPGRPQTPAPFQQP